MVRIQLFASIAVVAFTSLCGWSIARTSQMHCRQLAEIIRAVKVMRVQIVCMSESMGQALRQTDYLPFKVVAEKIDSCDGADKAWRIVADVKNTKAGVVLSEEEKRYIGYMLCRLGSCEREIQEELLDNCCSYLEDALKDACERSKRASKLYTSLGFLFGLCAVILII